MYSLFQEKIQYTSIKVRICITDDECFLGQCPKKSNLSHNCPIMQYQTHFPPQIKTIIYAQSTLVTEPKMGTPLKVIKVM